MPRFVHDLHCDLPTYLAWSPESTFSDAHLPCNLAALQQGNVAVQVCAIFTAYEADAWTFAQRQLRALHAVQASAAKKDIQLLWGIENAACWFADGIQVGMQRLATAEALLGRCSYVGLTWNGPGPIAGGCGSDHGISTHGMQVLAALIEHGVPIDLSHLNDLSAQQLLTYLDKYAPAHPLLASHANARSVLNHPRNLPDWLLIELIRRHGLIGICWYQDFVGPAPDWFWRHVEHILALDGAASLALGTDFMGLVPYPPKHTSSPQPYFRQYATASHIALWQSELQTNFGTAVATQLLHANPQRWLKQHLGLAFEDTHILN